MKLLRCLVPALLLLGSHVVGAQAADKPLRIAVDPTFPPMEYIDQDQHTGFDIELAQALAKELKRTVQFVDIDYKGLVPAVLANRADIALSAIYITDERKKVVDFFDPYYAGGLVIMVQKNNQTINGPKDLTDKKIAVQVGTKSVQFVKGHFPKAQVFEVEKNQEMFNMLETGRANAVVTGKPAAKLYARVRQTTRVLDEQLTVEQYGVVVGKNHPELAQSINQALKTLKDNGVYDALVKKWFESASS